MYGRRRFLRALAGGAAGMAVALLPGCGKPGREEAAQRRGRLRGALSPVTLFLCGDVMTGRAIDQVLPHPSDPRLHEPFVHDARDYLVRAERVAGPIPRPASFAYVWGEALGELARRRPHAGIANLETAITRSDGWWRGKSIHYRMHPGNTPCLAAGGIGCCVLANNHVLDWGYAGLAETLATLDAAGIPTAGAGANAAAASRPAVLSLPGRHRLLVFAAATRDSGVPATWVAGPRQPGVRLLPDLSRQTVEALAADVRRHRRRGDRVLFSLHWGGNWGFEVSAAQRGFAHALVEVAGADVVHGHSSHHVKGIEIHRGRPILYGCGDFLDDYEGIGGDDAYRGDLGAMYFVTLDAADGRLLALDLVPTRLRRFRVELARRGDRRWLLETLRRECARWGCGVVDAGAAGFAVTWPRHATPDAEAARHGRS